MAKCVMLGNGINRCIFSNVSWGDILLIIANNYNVKLNKNISFPMQFETLVNQILQCNKNITRDAYTEIKGKIIELLNNVNLPANAPHKKLVGIADSIITTNYDFLIECSIDDSFSVDNLPVYAKDINNKYNLRNSIKVSGKEVFHIHGDLRKAQSICLGYEHYAGTVQHLRSVIATKKEVANEKLPAIVLALREPFGSTNIWAEKFFTENVHIVGLGLTQSEIDIWWLITYRATLLYSDLFNCQGLINNNIVYHDIGTETNEDMKFMLENLGVKYCFYQIPERKDEYYLQKYIEIANIIEQS